MVPGLRDYIVLVGVGGYLRNLMEPKMGSCGADGAPGVHTYTSALQVNSLVQKRLSSLSCFSEQDISLGDFSLHTNSIMAKQCPHYKRGNSML